MTCKKCIHYVVCEAHLKLNDIPLELCGLFKDKSKFIELPMKTTNRLKEELTQYCQRRCVDEL